MDRNIKSFVTCQWTNQVTKPTIATRPTYNATSEFDQAHRTVRNILVRIDYVIIVKLTLIVLDRHNQVLFEVKIQLHPFSNRVSFIWLVRLIETSDKTAVERVDEVHCVEHAHIIGY